MFTPPPSPLPSPVQVRHVSTRCPTPPSSSTPSPTSVSPFSTHQQTSPKPRCTTQAGPSLLLPMGAKKRAGKQILLFVIILPVVVVFIASFRRLVQAPLLFNGQLIWWRNGETPQPSPSHSSVVFARSFFKPTQVMDTSNLPTIPNPVVVPTPMPQPFDVTLTSNFSTVDCSNFFTTFLQQENFRQCRAVSFLLNASSAFLTAQHNLTQFNQILAATCNTIPSADMCASTMSSYLAQLSNHCSEDLDAGNPIVLQAQVGFQSYLAMRQAFCLDDPTANVYCYMEALAQVPSADIYMYSVPFGTPIPPGIHLNCDPCTQSVLAIYSQYVQSSSGTRASPVITVSNDSGNSTTVSTPPSPLPILSKAYPAAAHMAVDQCGGTFASIAVTQNAGFRYGYSYAASILALVFSHHLLV